MEITMATPAIVLGAASLAWIALLARIFFLPGAWNVQWWLNTGPFVVGGFALVGVATGWLEPLVEPAARVGAALATASVLTVAAGLVLAGCALGTHRRRLALWHQTDDEPEHLVTEGPYAKIRHPFYTSYLLCLAGCVLAAPHLVMVLVLGVVAYRLHGTAAREERRFLESEALGTRYGAYVRRTGRFLPPWIGRRAAIALLALGASGCMPWTTPSGHRGRTGAGSNLRPGASYESSRFGHPVASVETTCSTP
jgi:protein-S-isoprenylcysteine O-methyltransferase Ste14